MTSQIAKHQPEQGGNRREQAEYIAKRFSLPAAMFLLLAGCADLEQGKAAIEAHGFSDVVIGNPVVWGCDEKDWHRIAWTGTGPTGRRVEGVVCSGPLKGWTVRVMRVQPAYKPAGRE